MRTVPRCKPPRQRHCWVPIPTRKNFDDLEHPGEWLDVCLGCGAVTVSIWRDWCARPKRTFLYHSEVDHQKAIKHYGPISVGRTGKK